MSELFEDNEDDVVEVTEDFDAVSVDVDLVEIVPVGLDARRRLENMLDEKRLRDELDDSIG
ncbi:MAG: PA3496 family putative envelope integrity protein [Legionellales bacterium]